MSGGALKLKLNKPALSPYALLRWFCFYLAEKKS
jgi:hypothetical protein